MPVTITCPVCGDTRAVPDEMRGRPVRCQACQKPFVASLTSKAPIALPAPTKSLPSPKRSKTLFVVVVGGLALIFYFSCGLWLLMPRGQRPVIDRVTPRNAETKKDAIAKETPRNPQDEPKGPAIEPNDMALEDLFQLQVARDKELAEYTKEAEKNVNSILLNLKQKEWQDKWAKLNGTSIAGNALVLGAGTGAVMLEWINIPKKPQEPPEKQKAKAPKFTNPDRGVGYIVALPNSQNDEVLPKLKKGQIAFVRGKLVSKTENNVIVNTNELRLTNCTFVIVRK